MTHTTAAQRLIVGTDEPPFLPLSTGGKKRLRVPFSDALEKRGHAIYCDLMDGLSSLGQETDTESVSSLPWARKGW